jgi:hypothetical protein
MSDIVVHIERVVVYPDGEDAATTIDRDGLRRALAAAITGRLRRAPFVRPDTAGARRPVGAALATLEGSAIDLSADSAALGASAGASVASAIAPLCGGRDRGASGRSRRG